MKKLNGLDWIALILVIIGALNWGLVGIVGLDLVAALGSGVARVVYILVGLAGIYTIYLALKSGKSEEIQA